MIQVTLAIADQVVDLRLPTALSVHRLGQELESIFSLPAPKHHYQLRVVNKGLLLSAGDRLVDYPITTGDYLRLEEI